MSSPPRLRAGVLRGNGFEKELLQRNGNDVDRDGLERAGAIDDRVCAAAGQHAQRAARPAYPLNAGRVRQQIVPGRRVAVEDELDAPITPPQIVQLAVEHRPALLDDGDAIRDLL